MEILSAYSATNLVLIFIAAFIIGLAKAGLKGIDMLNVTHYGYCIWWQSLHGNRIALALRRRYCGSSLLPQARSMEAFLENNTLDGYRNIDWCVHGEGHR